MSNPRNKTGSTQLSLVSRHAWICLWLPIILISALHYTTGAAHFWLHDIFRRLYYIPIVIGAFSFGRRGALAAAFVASLIYAPHAFASLFHADPATTVEKCLEIVLYILVALITGTLADRQKQTTEHLEEMLEENKEMSRELVRSGRLQALGELTAGLTQEIKNPLLTLKDSAAIIADELSPLSLGSRHLSILSTEIERLDALLGQFLDFATPARFEVAELRLSEIIEYTVTVIGSQAETIGADIEWHPSPLDIMVIGDREKVVQVVCNLLLNAIQSAGRGGTVRIRCGQTVRRRCLYGYIEIEDSGPGVPVELREKIFNPFFTTKKHGTGLGLSIASRIVDDHGGYIEVDDAHGGGCVFRVLLQSTQESDLSEVTERM